MRKKMTAEEKRIREWVIEWLRDRNNLKFKILPVDDRPDFLIEMNENKERIGFEITQIVNQNIFKVINPPKKDVKNETVYRCNFALEPRKWIQELFPKKNGKVKSYVEENDLDRVILVIFCDLVPDNQEEIRLFINQELCDYFYSLIASKEIINFDQILYVNMDGNFSRVYNCGKLIIPERRSSYSRVPRITVEQQSCIIKKENKNIDFSKNNVERDVTI